MVVALVLGACSDGGDDGDGDGTGSAPPTTLEVSLGELVTGGRRGVPANAMPEGLADRHGYVEEERIVSGTATAYTSPTPLTEDGRWSVEPGRRARYRTRILVRRPRDESRFNGTVVVEWLNVTSGRDADPDFGALHPELLGEGYAYVAVSAQVVGVEGGDVRIEVPGVPREALAPLVEWDPERYGSLDHPGDEFSYDLFSQIGRLARSGAPLGGLDVEHVIAVGESQSAGRLMTYVNGVHPLTKAYDGFLIHSRGASGAALNPADDGRAPARLVVRPDVDAPVLQFETETDLTRLRFVEGRQPDDDHVVTWEVAGTAHADRATLEYGLASGRRWSRAPATFDPDALCGRVNEGPQAPVLRAALRALRAWVVDDRRPPRAEPIRVADGAVVRDENGNALGGVRTPPVDAPIATLSGDGNASSIFCLLFGSTTPLPPARVLALHPAREDYVTNVRRSADAAVAAGFLLDDDAEAMVEAAATAAGPWAGA